ALPCDIPTLKVFGMGNFTCPDNIFCSPGLLPAYICCDTEPSLQPVKTDHFPIIQVLDIETVVIDHVPSPLFCTTNWGEFCKALMEELSALERSERYETVEQVETAIQRVEDAIQHVISTHVKMSKPSPYWRCWYTSLLDELRKESTRFNREVYQHRCVPNHPVHGGVDSCKCLLRGSPGWETHSLGGLADQPLGQQRLGRGGDGVSRARRWRCCTLADFGEEASSLRHGSTQR
ncbi:hypothetical protein B0H17DRAFT_965139, partial [Mycena rosella]